MAKSLRSFIVTIAKKIDILLYRKKDFVIISNNCFGAEIYKRLELEYNTPFVGLFIYGPDYIKLLENFEYYIDKELCFVSDSKWINTSVSYPIGILNDIEIHFLHYKNKSEAFSKWNRRLNRMKLINEKDKYFFKICDRDFTGKEILLRFHKLPYKNKISFSINQLNENNHLVVKENENNHFVPDGVSLYRYSFQYIDLFKWINTGKITKNRYSNIKSVANIV